jgi:IS1 family transposase
METKRKAVCGQPDLRMACTSHIERQNLSIRMGLRRFTRLTNAFSKKLENHEAALGLYFAYYNWCRVHSTLKTTPAVAS